MRFQVNSSIKSKQDARSRIARHLWSRRESLRFFRSKDMPVSVELSLEIITAIRELAHEEFERDRSSRYR